MFGGLVNYLKNKKEGALKGPNLKMPKVINEFKANELHSGSPDGPVVENPQQAIAIGMSEERKRRKGGYK